MKEFKNIGQPITSINGKNPVKAIKHSQQYSKVLEPIKYEGIIIDAAILSKGKVYRDNIHGHYYILGYASVWQIEEVIKPALLHPVFQNILAQFGIQ